MVSRAITSLARRRVVSSGGMKCLHASLIPRPSHPSVCRLQYYNAGEGLVKLSHVV